MNTSKFKVKYSNTLFQLSAPAFRLWMLLEYDAALRNLSLAELATAIDMDARTIRRIRSKIAGVYKTCQTVGYLPTFLINAAITHSAAQVLAWMFLKANEEASPHLYLTDVDIAQGLRMSARTVAAVRKQLAGRYIETKLVTRQNGYMRRNPAQRLLNALAIHQQVTQITLLNPETGKPIEEQKVDPLQLGSRLTNKILSRFGLKPLQPLEEPGIRVLDNKNQLFIWPTGGFSLRGAGTRSKADKGKKQIAKGNVFELWQLLARISGEDSSPEAASRAVRFLNSTSVLSKHDQTQAEAGFFGTPKAAAVAAAEGEHDITC